KQSFLILSGYIPAAIEEYCVSCDWSQLVTWYKAAVNSLVPCDLCDHSQISHVVSNDVRSDILLTTLHVITDWRISDHMIGTLHRGPALHRSAACSQSKMAGAVY
ncbi:unnamed protein product, partial [Staurois parvus]